MARGYYPRGEDDLKVTSRKRFFEIVYYKNLVASGDERARAFYSDKSKFEKAVKRMIETKVEILYLTEWNIPEDTDYTSIRRNLKAMEEAKTSLMDTYMPLGYN